jgi:hypothetical protein
MSKTVPTVNGALENKESYGKRLFTRLTKRLELTIRH